MMNNFYQKIKNFIILTIKGWFKICEHERCWKRYATECWLPDNETEKPDSYYCIAHAQEEGFCWVCGQLCAGMEGFDFLHPGLCDNCYDQIHSDFYEDVERQWDEEFYENYAGEDYP